MKPPAHYNGLPSRSPRPNQRYAHLQPLELERLAAGFLPGERHHPWQGWVRVAFTDHMFVLLLLVLALIIAMDLWIVIIQTGGL